jgi:hypothetical protein
MEQYHQTGAKLDNKYKSVSADRQADARSSRLRRSKNTQTQAAIENVSKLFTRKRHGNHEANEKLKHLKTEKREQQLHQIRNSQHVIPLNNDSLNTADDDAASPLNVPDPDDVDDAASPPNVPDKDDGTTGAI